MGCLPESGGCEKRFVQPFVDYLNAVEGTAFRHTACLDVEIRDTPQPEALYTDEVNQRQMVIERKSLVWPLDYASRHRNDHHLVDRLCERLPSWAANGPYTISLPSLLKVDRQGIEALSHEICAAIDRKGPLGGRRDAVVGLGAFEWSFRHRSALDDDDAPMDRILFLWDILPEHGLPPWPCPADLALEFGRVLAGAARKFENYGSHRCVVLLEPQGAVAHTPAEWWTSLVSDPIALQVSELWLAEQDFADPDGEPYWSFERLLPFPIPSGSEGCA